MTHPLKPGVVTGVDYLTLVKACKDSGYALPAVNVANSAMISGALAAAKEAKSDIIIQLSNGGAASFAMGLEGTEAKVAGAIAAASQIHELAKSYGVCVILHTDHADEKNLPWVDGLLTASEARLANGETALFSSHMIDLSHMPAKENLATSKKYLERMVKLGIGLEIELGVTGGEEDGVDNSHVAKDKLYTNPDDALQACETLWPVLQDYAETQGKKFEDVRDMLTFALSFGNVHGVYKPGNVVLTPSILKDCQKAVAENWGTGANPMPLVFHGGSGTSAEVFREAIGYGVVKVNIDTNTQFTFTSELAKIVTADPQGHLNEFRADGETPNKKIYDPRVLMKAGHGGVKNYVKNILSVFGAAGKSLTLAPEQQPAQQATLG